MIWRGKKTYLKRDALSSDLLGEIWDCCHDLGCQFKICGLFVDGCRLMH